VVHGVGKVAVDLAAPLARLVVRVDGLRDEERGAKEEREDEEDGEDGDGRSAAEDDPGFDERERDEVARGRPEDGVHPREREEDLGKVRQVRLLERVPELAVLRGGRHGDAAEDGEAEADVRFEQLTSQAALLRASAAWLQGRSRTRR
jgi:hypothetical protein